jgi:hypothetical protein
MWSRSEKAIAYKVFDAALNRELLELTEQAKQKASKISQPQELWDLEQYLTERRKDIDQKYDRRSSQLTSVLGRLLFEGRFTEQDLRCLKESRLSSIRPVSRDPGRSIGRF